MQYRSLGRLGYKVSALGFGLMRLPLLGGDAGQIDEDQTIQMVQYAVEHGVNYFDTAWVYHKGQSECVLGKALSGGLRQRVKIATKMPTWEIKTRDDFDRFLDQQLERLGTSIDLYLVHCLNATYWPALKDMGLIQWAERSIAAGRFGGLGFSFHDHFPVFKRILNEYDGWSLCQIQYNYMDKHNQAGKQGLELAAQRGLAVAIMEPLRGGALASAPPQVAKLWESASVHRSPAEWGLQWLWDHPQIGVVLSGMSSLQQMVENIAAADRSAPHSLSDPDRKLIKSVAAKYRELYPVQCTGCRYCLPCSNGVEIPRILKLYNECSLYGDPGVPRYFYKKLAETKRADRCKRCFKCEARCPQRLMITELLAEAHEKLSG